MELTTPRLFSDAVKVRLRTKGLVNVWFYSAGTSATRCGIAFITATAHEPRTASLESCGPRSGARELRYSTVVQCPHAERGKHGLISENRFRRPATMGSRERERGKLL